MKMQEKIAKAFFENHEEQCCTCGEWDADAGTNFMKPAKAVLEELAKPLGDVPLVWDEKTGKIHLNDEFDAERLFAIAAHMSLNEQPGV